MLNTRMHFAVARTGRIALISGLLAYGFALMAQNALTNDKIVAMTKAGLKSNLIVSQIRELPGNYQLTPDALIALKKASVDDAVIDAMLEKRAETSNDTARTAAVAAKTPSPTWKTEIVHDKLTGEATVEATQSITVEGRAKVLVTASCGIATDIVTTNSSADRTRQFMVNGLQLSEADAKSIVGDRPKLDTRMLNLRFKYISSAAGVALRRSEIPQSVAINRAGQGTISSPRACTFLRVMVGDQGREGVQSLRCNTENEASISFANLHAKDAMKTMGLSFPTDPKSDSLGIGKWMNNAFNTIADMNDTTIATMDEVFAADNVRVELPLTNNDSALVGIHPQEPSFKEFAATCAREFPAPPPQKPDLTATLPMPKPPTDPLAFPKPLPQGRGPVYTTPVQPTQQPGSNGVIAPPISIGPLARFVIQTPQSFDFVKDGWKTQIMLDQPSPQGNNRTIVTTDPKGGQTTFHFSGFTNPDSQGNPRAPRRLDSIEIKNPGGTTTVIQPRPGESIPQDLQTSLEQVRTAGTGVKQFLDPVLAGRVAGKSGSGFDPEAMFPVGEYLPPITYTNAPTANNISPSLAVLSIHSGFPSRPNPLSRIDFYLMQQDFPTTLKNAGIPIPAGASPKQAFARYCGGPNQKLTCDATFNASKANPAATALAGPTGDAEFTPVPPGDYYLLIYSYGPGRPQVYWNEKLELKPGVNSFTAGMRNAKPLH